MTALAAGTSVHSPASARRDAGLMLRSLRGNADSPLIPLAIGRYVIGSAPDADVQLDIAGVDPQHAVLLVGPQRSVLKAFSRFTWVNDGVIRECAVRPGDRICLGPVEFEVLKGKTRRRRTPASRPSSLIEAPQPIAPPAFSGWTTTGAFPPAAEPSSGAVKPPRRANREKLIGELNAELLQQLSQLIERETVAVERERRLVEQMAQLEGRRRLSEERQQELDRIQSEMARAEADWRTKSAEIVERSAQLRSERESLERDRQTLSGESARLKAQEEALEERRASLDLRQARLDEQQSALDFRASQLAAQEQRHAEAVAQALATSKACSDDMARLAEQQTLLQRSEEQLQRQREQLGQEREQFESDRDKLFAERAHLATREVEIAELRRRLHEQQSELQARNEHSQGLLDEAATQHSSAHEDAARLAEREQRIEQEESELAALRAELDDRRQELDEQQAAWMLERHTEAARANGDQREAVQEAEAEITMLRSQISELQDRLREERRLWDMERAELASRAEAVEAEPPAETEAIDEPSLSLEVARLQEELEAERQRFQQERDAWEAEQDLLLRDRQALEAEWRRLEERASQSRWEPPAETPHQELPSPPPIPSRYLLESADEGDQHLSAESTWPEEEQSWETVEASQQQVEPGQAAVWDEESYPAVDPDEEQHYGSINDEHSAGFADQESSGGESPAHSQGDDVLSLRAQLAELFGFQPGSGSPDADFAESPEGSGSDFESRSQGADHFEQAGGDDPLPFDDSEPETSESSLSQFGGSMDDGAENWSQQSDEEIMSAYLARLLKKSPEELEPRPAPVAEPSPVVEPQAASETSVPAAEPRPARRLNPEEKETLRANLDSFRELANQQARAAVAKYQSNELKSGMQMTSVVAVLITVVGCILLSAELWSSQSYRLYGFLCLAAAGLVGVYILINGIKIRRLKAVQKAAQEMTEALGGSEHEDQPEEQPAAIGPAE